MSAGLVGHGEIYGGEPVYRGFWCLAHIAGGSCRADVGLCDLCALDVYCLLEAFVPVIVPALDAAASGHAFPLEVARVRQALDEILLGAVGLLFDPVEPIHDDEARAWELMTGYDPPIRTTLQLAEVLMGLVAGGSAHKTVELASLARELKAGLAEADEMLRGLW